MASPPPRARVVAALAGLALTGCGSDPSGAVTSLAVSDARSPVPANPDVAAVYLDIGDPGDADDRLVAARTDVAERVELHESVVDDDGTARMEEQPDGIAVPAGKGASLEPGGLHLMLLGPEELSEGDTFDLTLEFDRSGERTVEVTVTGDAGAPDDEDGDAGHG